ncbi:hypothetical protein CH371_20020 [Leptospira wolffii]|uniref:RiboL-PSP-HEPN domain-containing protein n=1 Tax=Leptospira wolffii TaxID=409998 RepID=A0A2M9Z6L5_9LEPT|nr:HEPN domain-containing protein [Leptospira wolffii]PJZ64066.1 hypothetical protein CH371_20020 [Leptospira wolffii]
MSAKDKDLDQKQARHSAKSLFDLNITSADDCFKLHLGLTAVQTTMNTEWLLRAAIVFIVSAIDTYFHDKIKYSVGKYKLNNLPKALARFQIPMENLEEWQEAKRKGNVIRNWITEYLAVRPIQKPDIIADYLKLIGIEAFWDTLEKDKTKQKELKEKFNKLITRRNQIAHEGDRQSHRRSGKKLRPIDGQEVEDWIKWSKSFIASIEKVFPT